jgi:two-component system CheB/CheR fusion protein
MNKRNGGEAEFDALLAFLKRSRGFDFSSYKRPSLMRRIQRHMQAKSIAGYSELADYLEVHPEEFSELFNSLLINVTSFFRDPDAWEQLSASVISPLLKQKKAAEPVRVWCAGCASGEEAYSLAMALGEAMGVARFREQVKIYATDLDEEALNQARQRGYGAKDLEPVDAKLRSKYFERAGGRWQFRADLRRSVIFGRHNLARDAPISALDLISCRNTLMYFNAETQEHILSRFHFALNPKGHLFLGRAEMLLTHGALFVPVDLKARIFAKASQERERPPALLPARRDPLPAAPQTFALRERSSDDSPVPRIVVDQDGTLALANQSARTLFSLNAKDIGRLLQDLEMSYRPADLRSLIDRAYDERRAVALTNITRTGPDGERRVMDIMVVPVFDAKKKKMGVGITFLDVTQMRVLGDELQQAREELQTTTEELQSSNEELETTNEELQSSNEELETTNEELQSTNEELETMNEEMQATNEELQTVNQELQQRGDELNQLNAFLESVLGGLRSGAVVINQQLNVLMWNRQAEELWGLRPDEVQGRSLMKLDFGLPVAELEQAIHGCLRGDHEHKDMVLEAVNRRGKKIHVRVACTPLLAAGGKREGAILLMDEAKHDEAEKPAE